MPIRAEYLGMGLSVDDLDIENTEYFRHCAEHDFHLHMVRQPRIGLEKSRRQGDSAFL